MDPPARPEDDWEIVLVDELKREVVVRVSRQEGTLMVDGRVRYRLDLLLFDLFIMNRGTAEETFLMLQERLENLPLLEASVFKDENISHILLSLRLVIFIQILPMCRSKSNGQVI